MNRAIVLSGGVAHDFAASTAELTTVLAEVGIASQVLADPEQVPALLSETDLLVVNMLRWRMLIERYEHLRDEHALSLTESTRQALATWIRGGGALLAMHAATICFDDWPEWKDLVGGRWGWETSSHPPLGPLKVRVHPDRHPLVAQLPEHFTILDEAYGFLDLTTDVVPLITAEHGGAAHPLLWAREVGAGRVVYDALGHHAASFEPPEHRVIVQRAALWAMRSPTPLPELARR